MKNTFTLCLILLAFISFAQNERIDSLQHALINYDAQKLEHRKNFLPDESDTTKVNMLNALSAELIMVSNFTSAEKYANEALTIAKQIGFKKAIAISYGTLGIIYNMQGNYAEALKNHMAALKVREESGDKNGTANSYNNIGRVFYEQAKYPEALKYYFVALKIRQETDDKKGLSASYGNIGSVYIELGNYPEAVKNYFAALKIHEEVDNKNGIAASYNDIGNVYFKEGNYSESLKNHFASLKIMKEIGNKAGIANSYSNIGLIYQEQGNYTDALQFCLDALRIEEEIGVKKSLSNSYLNIGVLYTRKGEYTEALNNLFISLKMKEEIGDVNGLAIAYFSIGDVKLENHEAAEARQWFMKGLNLAKEIKSLELLENLYGGLAKADNALGNFKGAYENHKLFVLYRDSLNNEEGTKRTLQTKMQYEFDKKQVADSLKFSQEKELSAVKLQKQKAVTYGGFAGIAITIVLLFFVYRNYSKQRIANQKLKEAQEQLIKSEKMAAFGMMASRVSHEIQNPLNFVTNFSEMSEEMVNEIMKMNNEQERNDALQDLITNLQKINHHSMRADAIVKQLQEHTKKGTAHEYFEVKPE